MPKRSYAGMHYMLILPSHQNKDFNLYKDYSMLIIIKFWSFSFKLSLMLLFKALTANIWKTCRQRQTWPVL